MDADDAIRLAVDRAESEGAADKRWRVVLGGDWAATRGFAAIEDFPPDRLYGDLLSDIRGADLSIVNLESAIAGETAVLKDGPNLRGHDDSAEALVEAGFAVATLGNNHTRDYGREGLLGTIARCQAAGLGTVGAGADLEAAMEPLIVERCGVRIGVLSLADDAEGEARWNRDGVGNAFDIFVTERVRALRERADFVMVIVHGGKEYVPVPPPYWYRQVLAIGGSGADIVIGHHPHVPQGMVMMERDESASDGVLTMGPGMPQQVPVIFSTGNFVFRPAAMQSGLIPPCTDEGYLVEVEGRGGQLCGVRLIPYRIDPQGGPRKMNYAAGQTMMEKLQAISAPLVDPATIEAWWDVIVDLHWQKNWHARMSGLTAKLCAGDPVGLRHGRSHHSSLAHATLIDRAIERQLLGFFGKGDPIISKQLDGWFDGSWPEA